MSHSLVSSYSKTARACARPAAPCTREVDVDVPAGELRSALPA